MSLERTQALVLRDRAFSETSRTYSMLTERFGRLQFIGKGVRKPKSRLGGHLEWPCVAELVFHMHPTEGLLTLSDADVQETFPIVRKDPIRVGICAVMTELTDRTAPLGQADVRMFAVLLSHWYALERESDPYLVLGSFGLKWATAAGWDLEMGRCGVCGRARDSYWLDPERGGLVCPHCEPSAHGRVTVDRRLAEFWTRLSERAPSEIEGQSGEALAGRIVTLFEKIAAHFVPPPGKLTSLGFVRRFMAA